MKAAGFIRVFFRTRLILQLGKLVTISQFSPLKFASFQPELGLRPYKDVPIKVLAE
jgi:hypothetical protein